MHRLARSVIRVARPLWDSLSAYLIVNGSTPEAAVESILGEGVGVIQWREKSLPMTQQLRQARRLREKCYKAGALFLVNDRIDLAMATEADGVHLGQTDMPTVEARALLGPHAIIGASCARAEEVTFAEEADYLGTGPLYPTQSKSDAGIPVGLAAIGRLKALQWPIIGIGGITLERVAPVIDAGACGVAVISAVLDAPVPALAARALLQEVRRARDGGR
ncbi:thiamine phosphate synthase [Corallococcus exiguus]|nr:thiamine phosphate synthase [Corallococcus exiguus]NNC02619.1 thiamine phosphate synthase [Corallococcus exiguus]